jgi:hypothetical protein
MQKCIVSPSKEKLRLVVGLRMDQLMFYDYPVLLDDHCLRKLQYSVTLRNSDNDVSPELRLIENLRLFVEPPTLIDRHTDRQIRRSQDDASAPLIIRTRTFTMETPWSYIQVW